MQLFIIIQKEDHAIVAHVIPQMAICIILYMRNKCAIEILIQQK